MRKSLMVCLGVICSTTVYGWNTVSELENEASLALVSSENLLDAAFVSNINRSVQSTNLLMKLDAEIIRSIIHYQQFLDSADGQAIDGQLQCISNVVNWTDTMTNSWQFWTGRLLLASVYAVDNNFTLAYDVCTNNLCAMQIFGGVPETNVLNTAILKYYEMPDLEVGMAFKVFAGMAAAGAGMGNAATNYANQVGNPYRSMIFDFIR